MSAPATSPLVGQLRGTCLDAVELDRMIGRLRTYMLGCGVVGRDAEFGQTAKTIANLELLKSQVLVDPGLCPHGCGHWANERGEPCCPAEAAARECPNSDPRHNGEEGCPACSR